MSVVTKRIVVAALAATAATLAFGQAAQAAPPPAVTTNASTVALEETDWCHCDSSPLEADVSGRASIDGSPVVDTDGKQVSTKPMRGGHFVLFDSAGQQVRDADGGPITVDVGISWELEHVDGTGVLDEAGKPLNLNQPLDLGKLRASSVAAEEAKLRAQAPRLENKKLDVKTNDGSVLTTGLDSDNVRLNGMPLFTADGANIYEQLNRLWSGGHYITYPDGRVVDLAETVDVPALLGTAPAKPEPKKEPVEAEEVLIIEEKPASHVAVIFEEEAAPVQKQAEPEVVIEYLEEYVAPQEQPAPVEKVQPKAPTAADIQADFLSWFS